MLFKRRYITPEGFDDLIMISDGKKLTGLIFAGSENARTPSLTQNETPYGKTATYGEIADIIAAERGITKMSSRAVGGAVGKNPICIIIPCHRVLGANGAITGYGGGISNKITLLNIEKIPYRL